MSGFVGDTKNRPEFLQSIRAMLRRGEKMDDEIRRQDAIDTWRSDFKGYVDCLDLPRDDYNGIMEYIDEAPSAQSKQMWIPCSERLPEEKTYVLILADTIAGKMVKVSFIYKDSAGRNCWSTLDEYGKNLFDWQPTHWMPLPESWKGDTRE